MPLSSPVLVSETHHSLPSHCKPCTLILCASKWFSLMRSRIQCVSRQSLLSYLQGTFTSSLGKTFPINLAVSFSRCSLAKAHCKNAQPYLPHLTSFQSPWTLQLVKPYLKNNLMPPFSWLSVTRPKILLGASEDASFGFLISRYHCYRDSWVLEEDKAWGLILTLPLETYGHMGILL